MGSGGWGGDVRTKVPVKFSLFPPCVETILKTRSNFTRLLGGECEGYSSQLQSECRGTRIWLAFGFRLLVLTLSLCQILISFVWKILLPNMGVHLQLCNLREDQIQLKFLSFCLPTFFPPSPGHNTVVINGCTFINIVFIFFFPTFHGCANVKDSLSKDTIYLPVQGLHFLTFVPGSLECPWFEGFFLVIWKTQVAFSP